MAESNNDERYAVNKLMIQMGDPYDLIHGIAGGL